MGRPWVTHLLIVDPWIPSKILSDTMHIIGKLINFYIDFCNKLSNIKNVSQAIGGFLINPLLKCFKISLIFHGLLL
jgi:hypothetical protein